MTQDKEPGGTADVSNNTRVFLSYSRQDSLDEATALSDFLTSRNITVLRDTGPDSILPGEDWQDRLRSMIEESDKVVFLLSEKSAQSEICEWEIRIAEENGKSILPVLTRKSHNLPEWITQKQYLLLADEDTRDELLRAIEIDIQWERKKTQLTSDALDWNKAGRPMRSLLLREDAVHAAEIWRDTRPGRAAAPSAVVLEYIAASRTMRSKTQRRIAATALVSSLIFLALVASLFVQWREARAQEALAIKERDRATMEAEAARNAVIDGLGGLDSVARTAELAFGAGRLETETYRSLIEEFERRLFSFLDSFETEKLDQTAHSTFVQHVAYGYSALGLHEESAQVVGRYVDNLAQRFAENPGFLSIGEQLAAAQIRLGTEYEFIGDIAAADRALLASLDLYAAFISGDRTYPDRSSSSDHARRVTNMMAAADILIRMRHNNGLALPFDRVDLLLSEIDAVRLEDLTEPDKNRFEQARETYLPLLLEVKDIGVNR